jgi:general secretion pathway protein K
MKVLRLYTNQNGIALMVVLWVLVLLMALATEFAFSMKGEVNTTRNFKEDAETYHLAKAGIHLGMAEVLLPASFHALHPDRGLVIGPPTMKAQEEATEGAKNTYRSIEREGIPLGRGTITYSLEDENSKIPINKATRNTLVKVLTIAGVENGEKRDIIADSILDWIDANKNHRLNGAENDFYQNLTPPYFAKSAPIENLDELLKVRGINEKILYGNDKQLGLNQFFTVYNLKSINANTASPEVLSVIFSESQVKLIMSTREEKGFYDNSTSDYFRIRSTGRIEGSPTNHTINTVIQKIFGKDGPKLLTHYWNDNSF